MVRDNMITPPEDNCTQWCGVPLQWFPMRVTYNREMAVKSCLDELSIENFLPLRYDLVGEGSHRRRTLVPAIHNLIFIRSTQPRITELKMFSSALQPLRYMMRQATDEHPREILRVPDKQMSDFIRVASVEDDSVMFLDSSDYLRRPGIRVRVTEGYFAGVEGVIKRIGKNRRVVVQLEGIAAVAITYVPASHLMLL